MFRFLKRHHAMRVGLYLSDGIGIAIASIANSTCIHSLQYLKIDSYLLENEIIKDPLSLKEHLMPFFDSLGPGPLHFYLNLKNELTLSYVLKADSTINIETQIKALSPLPLEALSYDYFCIDDSLMLYLSKKNHIQSRQALFGRPHFQLKAIDLESMAVCRALKDSSAHVHDGFEWVDEFKNNLASMPLPKSILRYIDTHQETAHLARDYPYGLIVAYGLIQDGEGYART